MAAPTLHSGLHIMIDRFPDHSILVAAVLGVGAILLIASQIVAIFIP